MGPSIEQSVPGDSSLPRPAPGALNVVLIVLDDFGFRSVRLLRLRHRDLITGEVMILAGFLILAGNMFGRVVGVLVASVNALAQLAYLNHNTFWSFTMILVDILVIYGLVAHGGRLDEWSSDSA